MLKVDTQRWGQTPTMLRDQALKAPHPRTRERLLALYDVTQGKNATQVALKTGRNPQTVMGWVHQYNEFGAEGMAYQHSGGHPPLCLKQ